MTFAIITHVPHIASQDRFFAYAPYVNEMNIWLKYVDKVIIVAPEEKATISPIQKNYEHPDITLVKVSSFDLLNLKSIVKTVFKLPLIAFRIFNAMKQADHIHLRCPGNMGLLACVIQIFFPKRKKTAKYAGNWDPKSKQPWSYKLQQWILSTPFLTKNIQVLVYGQWGNTNKNIKPFFTATYAEEEKEALASKSGFEKVVFIFAGGLVSGKNPMYAVKLVERLYKNNQSTKLELFGDGNERAKIAQYIANNKLGDFVFLRGNQTSEKLKEAYKNAHFVILPSESEGWPKAIAEGMFWGCVPIATKVSCVPYMLDFGKRGVLLHMDIEKDVMQIQTLIANQVELEQIRQLASDWSRKFTLDIFESEIKLLLTP